MPTPTYTELKTLSIGADGLAPESITERILTVLSILLGHNPDGSQFTLPVLSITSRKILDYGTRIDTNPVFVGTNSQSALIGDTTWTVQQLFYDTSARLIDAQVISGISWTNRTTAPWRSPAGN